MTDQESIRLDKWLWAARFFKTRKLAAEAVSGGKVHVNGQRCKPAKEIKLGMQLEINKSPYQWEIKVLAINKQRRPAKEAVFLYEEAPASIERRQQLIRSKKEQHEFTERVPRPNKKQRRQIHRFKQG